jgi:parallel beta-helix repeat protein
LCSGNEIFNNTVIGNGQGGLPVEQGSHDNKLIHNTVSNNGSYGIYVQNSNSCWVVDNITEENANWGIKLQGSTESRVEHNVSRSNADGIVLLTSTNNTFTGNVAANNAGWGISVEDDGSTSNIFTANHLCTNGTELYDIYDLDANSFSGNYCDPGRLYTNGAAQDCAYECPDALCLCTSCETCEASLNGPACARVVLTEDIIHHDGTCIEWSANNTTFDCDGHLIDGDHAGGLGNVGIELIAASNNTIKNCTLSGFGSGIRASGGSGNRFVDSQVSDNEVGLRFENSEANSVRGNIVQNNIDGLVLSQSSDHIITGNRVNNNTRGLYLDAQSNDNDVAGNEANGNLDFGIRVDDNLANDVVDNSIKFNGGYGIHVDQESTTGHFFVSNDLCTNDAAYDIFDDDSNVFLDNHCDPGRKYTAGQEQDCANACSATSCTCTDCDDCEDRLNDPACVTVTLTADIVGHSGTCIEDAAGFSNKVFDCAGHQIDGDGTGYDDHGILMVDKYGNTVANCTITDFYDGIHLEGSSNNLITGNTITDHGQHGIYSSWSWQNEIADNTISANEQDAIFLSWSNGNHVHDNLMALNGHCPIVTSYSMYNRLGPNNTMTENYCAISMWTGSSYNSIFENIMFLHPC